MHIWNRPSVKIVDFFCKKVWLFQVFVLILTVKIIGCSTPEFGAKQVCSCSATLVDYPTVDEPVRNDLLKSSDRLKQEVNNEQV